MSGTTTTYAYPYATTGDTNDVPRDTLALANRSEVVAATFEGVKWAASATGATVGGSGALGITGSITVTSATYSRDVTISWGALATAFGSGQIDIELRKNGTKVQSVRLLGAGSGTGVFHEVIGSGTAPLYQLVMNTTGSGTFTVTSDGTFTWLTALVTRGA